MPHEQLMFESFRDIPVVIQEDRLVQQTLKPRHPLIEQIVYVYGSEELDESGCSVFDDGEDRMLIAINVEPKYERMLLAKVEPLKAGGFNFAEQTALLLDAQYTENTNRLTKVTFKVFDLSKLNGADEMDDWISFFWEESLAEEKLKEIFIEEVSQPEALERVKVWWALSPFEA